MGRRAHSMTDLRARQVREIDAIKWTFARRGLAYDADALESALLMPLEAAQPFANSRTPSDLEPPLTVMARHSAGVLARRLEKSLSRRRRKKRASCSPEKLRRKSCTPR